MQREIPGNMLTKCHTYFGIWKFGWFVAFFHIIFLYIFEFLCIVLVTFKFTYTKTFVLVYSSLSWNKCIVTKLSPKSSHGTDSSHHKLPSCYLFLWIQYLFLLPAPQAHNPFTLHTILPFLEFHINGITHYVVFWVWLLSLSIMHLKFIHIVVYSSLFTFNV